MGGGSPGTNAPNVGALVRQADDVRYGAWRARAQHRLMARDNSLEKRWGHICRRLQQRDSLDSFVMMCDVSGSMAVSMHAALSSLPFPNAFFPTPFSGPL
jgi:uncharacterized protein with von Willebrand factor type A (vWA) domain|eukprot:SAG25_NODE_3434_length_1084_cov_1.239594_2_plen_100_part_00